MKVFHSHWIRDGESMAWTAVTWFLLSHSSQLTIEGLIVYLLISYSGLGGTPSYLIDLPDRYRGRHLLWQVLFLNRTDWHWIPTEFVWKRQVPILRIVQLIAFPPHWKRMESKPFHMRYRSSPAWHCGSLEDITLYGWDLLMMSESQASFTITTPLSISSPIILLLQAISHFLPSTHHHHAPFRVVL